jgi:hypothetical protein
LMHEPRHLWTNHDEPPDTPFFIDEYDFYNTCRYWQG